MTAFAPFSDKLQLERRSLAIFLSRLRSSFPFMGIVSDKNVRASIRD